MFGVRFGRIQPCLGSFIHDNREDLLTVFTLVLAFSTILLWIATRDLANDAVVSSRRQLRAYVSVSHPKFEKPDPHDISIEVENGGMTPAYKLTGWVNTYWIKGYESALPDGFKFPDRDPGVPFAIYRSVAVLHPRKTAEFAFLIDLVFIEQCRRKEIALFFYGHVDYTDIFDRPHSTQFCYQYFPADVGIGHMLVMYDEHNKAT